MSLDDRARIARLREAPRTDLALAARMYRFCAALQTRLCRELERLDGAVRFSPVGEGERRTIRDGALFSEGHVAVWSTQEAGERGSFSSGLTLDLRAADPSVPSVGFALRYDGVGEDPLRPEEQSFGGEALLLGNGDTARFHAVWAAVCARHPGVVDYRAVRRRGGIAFGPLREDPEEAFHFVREVGRAFAGAYVPLVRRRAG